MRMTSSLESFNAKLNRGIPKKMGLFKFIEQLKVIEAKKSYNFYTRANERLTEEPRKKKNTQKERDSIIINLYTNLINNNKLTEEEFLYSVALRSKNLNQVS